MGTLIYQALKTRLIKITMGIIVDNHPKELKI